MPGSEANPLREGARVRDWHPLPDNQGPVSLNLRGWMTFVALGSERRRIDNWLSILSAHIDNFLDTYLPNYRSVYQAIIGQYSDVVIFDIDEIFFIPFF
jgi:hypothetical protein